MVRLTSSALALTAVLAVPAVATASDRDHDGIRDSWEKRNHVTRAGGDPDRDGLRNRQEYRLGTNPRNADSDDDGIEDSEENAGTVTSFTAGVLTITLANGSKLVANVTAKTEIDCGTRGDHGFENDDESGDARAVVAGRGAERESDDDEADDCTTADLVPGTVVHEAEVGGTAAGVVFKQVELVR
ncbi:MAG: hypothetical protein JWP17_2449 [Solirubrobacterales bacterium]|jgi:hypothetical protein|nr:hypothetical protein [Solirubrobacterales bacterium]